jgi:hypothetical protein
MKKADSEDNGLRFLLAFDGLEYVFEDGHRLRFRIGRVRSSPRRPHGLSYSLTLHAPDGRRLVGFDNAHRIGRRGAHAVATDHWHSERRESAQIYPYEDAATLIDDFFNEVEKVLKQRGVKFVVIQEKPI